MLSLFRIIWKTRKYVWMILLFLAKNKMQEPEPRPRKHVEAVRSPANVSKKGWKIALSRTKEALKDKDLSTSAAGLAYYATLSFFPTLIGLASFYVLFTSPSSLTHGIDSLKLVLPSALADMFKQELGPIAHSSTSHVGVAAILSVAALLWTTSGGLQNLVKATNKVYEVEETRSFVKLRLTSILLSLGLLIIGTLVMLLLVLQPDALHHWGMPGFVVTVFPVLRWPVLVALISLVLALIYRYAPDRKEPGWQWVSWGAVMATVIWLAVSALFFVYVQNFANFNKTYGIFAGIIVLMTWFNYSALIILIGGQVNKKLESVTKPVR
jgi:membrane protein